MPPKSQTLRIDFSEQPVAATFVETVATGINPLNKEAHVDEILALGPRGEGKTMGVLCGMIAHAQRHQQHGFPLPVPWLGVRDTFANHRMTTVKTLEKPIWGGLWQLFDQGKTAIAYLRPDPGKPPQEVVELRLFGLEDQVAIDKLKQETVGLWFEEAAPSAGLVTSGGVSESAWDLAITSCRVPSHFKPKVITENYPDEDDWTWERWKPTKDPVFVSAVLLKELMEIAGIDNNATVNEAIRQQPNGTPWDKCIGINPESPERIFFRVPAGERASAEDRRVWAKALKDRPDLFVRLILGLPGQVQLGEPVAMTGQPGGYDPRVHVAPEPLKIMPGETLYMGFDFGHSPTCIIGQLRFGGARIYAALWQDGGMKQLLEYQVLPWLAKFAPWARVNQSLIEWGYDPTGDTADQSDIDKTAKNSIDEMIGGFADPGPIRWEDRKNALLTALGRRDGLVICPNPYTQDLRKALESKWIYPKDHRGALKSDIPKKPNHPWEDLGDAAIYMLVKMGIGQLTQSFTTQQLRVETNLTYNR